MLARMNARKIVGNGNGQATKKLRDSAFVYLM